MFEQEELEGGVHETKKQKETKGKVLLNLLFWPVILLRAVQYKRTTQEKSNEIVFNNKSTQNSRKNRGAGGSTTQ